MKPKSILILLSVAVIIAIVYYSFVGGDSQHYVDQIEEFRDDTDRFMRTSSESPFADRVEEYNGLRYFPPDEKYRIVATLKLVENKQSRALATSDGKDQQYQEYAYAEFDLGNRKNRLLILEIIETGPDRGDLFLAFGDETSANETYGGGRYLNVKKVPGSTTIELDFNKAYNPYCAYNADYSCPLPPRENLLDIPIRAGEMNYH